MQKYNPKEIEPKWQKVWDDEKTFKVSESNDKQKFYSLIEFPYPSGAGLHVGHPRPFTAMDVVSRKKRMEGYNVLYPVGFDAFGLPTENYAIKTGRPPAEVTAENIANFTRQLKALGYSFDWDRVVDTTDPAYFKWTQWIFMELFKAGLAYKTNIPINWCLSCKIGLANEEIVNGACERCGGIVEKRDKEQWMLRITEYAEELLEGLNDVDYIPQAATQQRNWIGKSTGASIKFKVKSSTQESQLEVFTTRPDTIFGATYMVIAPEHNLVHTFESEITNLDEIKVYSDQARLKSDLERTELQKEKTGVEIQGVKAINPATGEEIPVFIADYVLSSYGTGAIMAVPAHDERDFEFAQKYGLEIVDVVAPHIVLTGDCTPQEAKATSKKDVVTAIVRDQKENKYLVLQWDKLFGFVGGGVEQGESFEEAIKREVLEETGYTDFQITEVILPNLYGHGFKPRKDVNCFDLDRAFLVDILDTSKQTNHEGETDEHTIHWLTEKEVSKLISLEHHAFMWDWFINNNQVYTEQGIAINSDFLNGLTTEQAKEKIIQWLEEQKIGSRETNYKLRDWVFSRQRYWGEPIPLVHCESCAEKKQKVLLIHGFTGSADVIWFPWLKSELEKEGFEVFAPTMSTSHKPTIESWMNELEPFVEQMDENDIILGHSLGASAAARILEKTNKKIGSLIFVAGAVDNKTEEFWIEQDRAEPGEGNPFLRKFWETPINWEKVNSLADYKLTIVSTDDPYISVEGHKELFGQNWFHLVWEKKGHICDSEYPELLHEILKKKFQGWIPVEESQLPLELPQVEKYEPTDTGESPLAAMEDWVQTTCPRCGASAKRETDTMPNWAGSSWYFLRYMDAHNNDALAAQDKLQYWGPIDWYNGGMEHTVLHLLYSRFWNQFLYNAGHIPFKEPYAKRTSHGMILAKGGEKMSKSKGNVVNPDDMIEQFGADALRTYIMFMGPFDQAVEWDTNGLVGVRRFLDRVWNLQEKVVNIDTADGAGVQSHVIPAEARISDDQWKAIQTSLHKTIKAVTHDIDAMSFNTAIARMMELQNELNKLEAVPQNVYTTLIKLLSPFAPHLCEELWQRFGGEGSVSFAEWPQYQEELTKDALVTIGVQINGKVRDSIEISPDMSQDQIKEIALASEKIQKYLEGKEIKKFIVVPGKIVSIVI